MNVGYKTKLAEEPDVYFILSDDDIFKNSLITAIKNKYGSDDVNVVFDDNEKNIDYKVRENPINFKYDDKKYKIFVTPKSHPDDQMRLVVMDVDAPKVIKKPKFK